MVWAGPSDNNNKLHAVYDEKGRPHGLLLTLGNTCDANVIMLAISAVPHAHYLRGQSDDSIAVSLWLTERGIIRVIPTKVNRKVQIIASRIGGASQSDWIATPRLHGQSSSPPSSQGGSNEAGTLMESIDHG